MVNCSPGYFHATVISDEFELILPEMMNQLYCTDANWSPAR